MHHVSLSRCSLLPAPAVRQSLLIVDRNILGLFEQNRADDKGQQGDSDGKPETGINILVAGHQRVAIKGKKPPKYPLPT